jgi:hypothetical protein
MRRLALIAAAIVLLASASAEAAQKYRYQRASNGLLFAIPIRAVYDETGFRRYEDGVGERRYIAPRPTTYDGIAKVVTQSTLTKPMWQGGAIKSRTYIPQPWERPAPKPVEILNPF